MNFRKMKNLYRNLYKSHIKAPFAKAWKWSFYLKIVNVICKLLVTVFIIWLFKNIKDFSFYHNSILRFPI